MTVGIVREVGEHEACTSAGSERDRRWRSKGRARSPVPDRGLDNLARTIVERQPRPSLDEAGGLRDVCHQQRGDVGPAGIVEAEAPEGELTVAAAREPRRARSGELPEPTTAPKACRQRTIGIPGDVMPKIRQRHYWGSDAWIAAYVRRSRVEGVFGNIKSSKTEDVSR
ncbi:MAG: hypothetical protein M0004_10655, partial [Actinomycetota bacterium]|nr:hypothetical protein [Actinomycetota bacterium]